MSDLAKDGDPASDNDLVHLKTIVQGLFPQGDVLLQTSRRMRELGERSKMLEPLIAETRQALDAELHRAALQAALADAKKVLLVTVKC